jgi:ParB-like chromosome segregation protein Spo0J
MPKPKVVWSGNEKLREFLVPLDTLTPHPANPRRHNTAAIRKSLDAFGQQSPVVALAKAVGGLPAGTIVKGHGTVTAAREAGWTHIASVPSKLSGDDVERYLLADNRSTDDVGYDDDRLGELLDSLAKTDRGLDATGFTQEDLDVLIDGIDYDPPPEPDPPKKPKPQPPAREQSEETEELVPVVLSLTKQEQRNLKKWAGVIEKEHGVTGLAAAILKATEAEYDRLWSVE